MSNPPLLEVVGLSKRFPGVLANDRVSFSVAKGEIHALLGENGAGKSTLVKMIYGVLKPDAGEMRLEGQSYAPARPSEARGRGIGMVFQHFSLFEALTVAENVALALAPALAKGDLAARIKRISESYGLKLEANRLVGTLSVGERQRVEIVRCLLQSPRLIIMDEPTSVLTPQEVDTLFETLHRLAREGCAILYISHKLEEIRALCGVATVLRAGRVVASCDPRQETAKSLAEMMIGATLVVPKREHMAAGEVRLELQNLSLKSHQQFGVNLENVTCEVRSGEILGIAGVAGNGQIELMQALIGERRAVRADAIVVDGTPVGHRGPDFRRRHGMCFVPEERLGHGSVPDMSLTENVVLSAAGRKRLARGGFIDLDAAGAFANEIVSKFNVKTAGIAHAIRSLSGGNLQKFIVGREILQQPSVLIASQPTWGVDAGAAAAIHIELLARARSGTAILIISQDLDELFAIATRISVIALGRLSVPKAANELTVEAIGRAMGGQMKAKVAHA
jgi:general nucleoside transport system ATP-binding protein